MTMAAFDGPQLADEFRKADPREVRADCPPAERIWAAVAGELVPEATREIVDHTARCGDCSVAWRIALEMSRDDEPEAGLAPVVPLRARLGRRFFIQGSVGLVAAALAVFVLLGPWRSPPGGGPADVERGAKQLLISVTAPGVQPKNAVVLRWSPYPEAERYSVTVTSPALDVLYRAFGLTTTEVRIPPESLSGQPSPVRLLWSVAATLPGGRVVDSPVFTVDAE